MVLFKVLKDRFCYCTLKEKQQFNSEKNFIGFAPDLVNFSANIVTFDKTSDTLDIENSLAGSSFLTEQLPPAPFYITINQLLDARLLRK